ncbi:MAG: glutamyl-tRNA reductase [Elusimicrobia bacterium]|nr:glutamyl-tRNA reductase [Elusimicrobiota bacterium]
MMNDWLVVGLNHATASVEIREAVSPKPDEAGRINSIVKAATGQEGVVVLSTCSRFEIYCQPDKDGEQAVVEWLARRAGRDVSSSLYVRRGSQAVDHLFRVAAGLDSWILGETEILGQCKAAYQGSCGEKTVNRYGHLAFQRALMVGKKVRNETRIVGGIASIGGAAAVMARSIFSDLKERVVVVFGAGTMAASSVRHLRSKGAGKLYISNRSLDKAQVLAAELGGEPVSLAEGFDRLDQADIAIFSTGADRYLLDGEAALALSRRRGGRSLFIIDIAMPRNVAPEVARAEGVYLYDIDDLKGVVQKSLAQRADDMARAADIVAAESSDCWARLTHPLPAAGRAPVAA